MYAAAVAPRGAARVEANPLDAIPQNLIPNGTSRYQTFVGPSWLLSRDQGETTVTRNANNITLATPAGNATITPAANGRVSVALPDGSSYTGRIRQTNTGAVFTTDDGKTVTFTRNGNRVDISLSGFGFATDRVGVYMRRK